MPEASMQYRAHHIRRVLITIPANAGTAGNLGALVRAALVAAGEGRNHAMIIGAKIHVAGAAYHVGDSTGSLPVAVGASAEYDEKVTGILDDTYVKADATAISNVPVSVYYSGDMRQS